MRAPLDPTRSHDRELTPDVALRWWSNGSLELTWRSPARGDRVHPDGTPLMRVAGSLTRAEAEGLYRFLGQLLGPA